MAYKVLGRTEELLAGYGPRKGLEGPFIFAGNRVLYYCNKEGSYWDPTTDFYVEKDEMDMINNRLMEVLKRA
jgi:hypothetical protein